MLPKEIDGSAESQRRDLWMVGVWPCGIQECVAHARITIHTMRRAAACESELEQVDVGLGHEVVLAAERGQ